jgi:hypothetical protein
MYKVKATLKQKDRTLDDLIALFEQYSKDAICGLVQDELLAYVEEDMLSSVTNVILNYADEVTVQMVVEDEELVAA